MPAADPRQTVQRRSVALLVTLALLLAAITMLYRFATMGGPLGGFENDEFVTLSMAQQMTLGEQPLRDFVDNVPLTIRLSAAALRLVGPTLYAEAALTSALLGLCAALLFLLAWRASGSIAIALVIALIQIAMAPRFYNYPKLLAYALAIPALWAYLDRPTRARLWLIALAGAVAFLLRLDHGAFVAIAGVITVTAAHWPDIRASVRETALLGAMALLLVSPYVIGVQRAIGLDRYLAAFADTTVRSVGRTNFKPQALTFDWSQPLVARVRRVAEPPRINVRWAPGVDDATRAGRERALGLMSRERLAADVWNYALADTSAARLAAIVHDPHVADTQGIDRAQFLLNDPAVLRKPALIERLWGAITAIRVLPGVLQESNAVPFLYYLLTGIPIATLVLAVAGAGDAGRFARVDRRGVAIVSVLALLINQAFLRGNLPSRLADVTEVVGVLAAWLTMQVLARRSRGGRALAIAAVCGVLVLTAASVQTIENVSGQVQQSGIGAGIRGLTRRTGEVYAQLTTIPPIAAWPPETPGMERLAWYVNRCTAPDDRVLVVSYAPELFFLARRGFAAGHVWIQPGFDTGIQQQQLMISRLDAQRVPIAITDPEPAYTDDYVASFPLLDAYLRRAYREIDTVDFGRGFRYRVLVRRDLPSTSTYQTLGLPCFG